MAIRVVVAVVRPPHNQPKQLEFFIWSQISESEISFSSAVAAAAAAGDDKHCYWDAS
jgi:hypothetical protein